MSFLSRRPSDTEEVSSSDPQPYLPSEPSRRVVASPPTAANVGVRAYLMTGGRASAQLAYETMLALGSVHMPADVRFERAAILDACRERPISVAEISAYLHIPIGVVRVLASDLVAEELLTAFSGPSNKANDITLLTNLIAGVRAL
jgi:Protein of unknown function (DUF742)